MLALKETVESDNEYAEAEAALAALAEQYPVYAAADVAEMQLHVAALEAGPATPGAAGALFAVAHNVKGQGAAFGYDLMTEFGEELCQRLRDREVLTAAEIGPVRALVAACDTVLSERLAGDGGPRGAALKAALGLTS